MFVISEANITLKFNIQNFGTKKIYLYLCFINLKINIMIPTLLETAQEMINFLNSRGQYQSFLDYAEEEIGHNREDMEEALDAVEEGTAI